MTDDSPRRVVITGLGIVSPLGLEVEAMYAALVRGQSGVVAFEDIQTDSLPCACGGIAHEFTGRLDDFGPLKNGQKKTIRKGLKVMCREIQMGVASAQRALDDAGVTLENYDRERCGVVFGSDYMVTVPEEFSEGVQICFSDNRVFQYAKWGTDGLSKVTPLWLLKYLPNMPAGHIAIYNDLRGPSNSITMREASGNLSIAEAYCAVMRGRADLFVAGATGTRLHPMRRVQIATQEELATDKAEPSRLSRPFDFDRKGLVLGEGAGAVVLEDLEHARSRGAPVYGEIIGYGSSSVVSRKGVSNCARAVENAIEMTLNKAGIDATGVGHIHAHGLSTRQADRDEATGIINVFHEQSDRIPVVAAKSHFGNLGAGSGTVELVASLMALKHGKLFPVLNYETPDADCPLNLVTPSHPQAAGESVLNVNFTPQGQASALLVRRCA